VLQSATFRQAELVALPQLLVLDKRQRPKHQEVQDRLHQRATGQAREGVLQGELRVQAEEVRTRGAAQSTREYHQGMYSVFECFGCSL
jgi:hypothetical protein